MRINVLPSNIANLIAAGEVVQRPSSVVKELMENAVDAGASEVKTIITDAGRTLIQVIDNGCGMERQEAEMCFERHATSKISEAEDLQHIGTFGFRGEALASIAAVAEVTLKTRVRESETGACVEFANSTHLSTSECAAPVGSNFAVRNLFYNVPARRKFLKSDNVEFKHIVEEFTRVALTRPEISFTLIHNDKEIYVLRGAKSLKYRIKDILGANAVDKVVDVGVETPIVNVKGYVCRPDLAKKTLGEQFFFVNGRFFRSAYFHKAVMKAYENLIAPGTTPSYFLYIEVNPSAIDVNIHPAKTEIKFEDDSEVFQIIFSCVREALGKNSFGAEIDFNNDVTSAMPVFGQNYTKFRPSVMQPNVEFDPNYDPFAPSVDGRLPDFDSLSGEGTSAGVGDSYETDGGAAATFAYPHMSSYVDKRDDYGRLFEDKVLPSSAVMVLKGRYILSPSASGLLVINIRRALQRIYYEKFLRSMTKNEHVAQESLIPVQVQVGVANRLVFDEHADMLERIGFDISPFGTDTVVVNGVPEGFSCEQSAVEAVLANVLVALSEDHTSLPGMMESAMAEKFAAIASSEGRPIHSPVEAQRLVETLFGCENSEYTSKGHKIMNIIPLEEIDKKF